MYQRKWKGIGEWKVHLAIFEACLPVPRIVARNFKSQSDTTVLGIKGHY